MAPATVNTVESSSECSGEERQLLLRQELEHRARNTLALIRSTFLRTMEASQSLEDAEMHFLGRFDVLARYQLSPGALDGAVDLQSLIRNELRNFQFGDDAGIFVAGPDVALSLDRAQPLALAIHELVTNALKFGALVTPGAELRVNWTTSEEVLNLEWSETGVPVVSSTPLRTGFGREYIEDALAYQLDAAASFNLRPGGLICSISLPLETDQRAA